MDAKEIISKLTLMEKAALLSGKNEWESRDIPRLGIQSITFSDGPHGLRRQEGAGDHLGLNASLPATCFPTAATVANSWDPSLGEEIGAALGEEAVAQNVDVLLGPGLNMKRSPLCGRNFEYFSEDPILAGKMAAAYVRGIQSKHVYSCPKHFAVNSREYRRMAMNAVVDERTLREIYLTAFEIAVKEGGAKTIMSAYNEVNGKYANENDHLLVDILRNEWGFDGIVVTDWGASNDHVAGVKCQSNVEMPNPGLDSARELIKAATEGEGRITEEEIDRAILPIIEAAIYFKENDHSKGFDKEAHHAIAKKAAVNSAVLLKNDEDILPLKAGTTVCLRGPFVDKPRYQGSGSSQVNSTKVETIREQIANYDLNVIDDPEKADVVLFFFGLDEIAESEGADRMSIDVPEYQIKELEELTVYNKHIIGVMSAGSSVKMPWLGNLQALLHGYLTGQAGASALLDIIVGKEIPTGKLSESYPFAYTDCSIVNYADTEKRNLQYREGPFIGYRYYDTADVAVQFPFGFGLSYTTFEYSALSVSEEGIKFTIKNTGNRDGAEIAQMYIGKSESGLIRPKKELKGFKKVWIKAGESADVEIPFDDKTFRYFSTVSNKWEIEGGEYEIYVGGNVRDIELTGRITKAGTITELPYDIESLPSYKTGKVRNVHYEEFEKLYAAPLPEEKVGPLDINDALCQMKDAKSGLCRLVYKVLKSNLDKSYEKGVPDLNTMFIYNMPFRAMSKMTGGAVSREMAESIVTIANGHFFRGLGGVIGGYFKNARANKKYEARLNHKE
ncbi:MAG: glycoside hydrolase family 3 C-terminal domain-containing protein [Pseudobutyrivibrio sp.]|uniref:glycoside hydrolase family 3 C-terminal domain-containing protein n=1 Tax=Pseudobutyrivibrio sp. TaxID=2014367 RepID=UPI0025F2B76E|nr:glycoside hydrolase family 3 C-terminal domain-containing protein [Pseudobutyrivibrio sp.]MBQ6463501.1 glycoside hydrolase family 3 C-terminal domain-containing protein [Pseudobutyrivibrio sp.]